MTMLCVQHVVERHYDDIIPLCQSDHTVKAIGRNCDGDDGIVALVDEILGGTKCSI